MNGKNEEKYSGWTNYETWRMANEILNDGLYDEFYEMIENGDINDGEDMRIWLEEISYNDEYGVYKIGYEVFCAREWYLIDFDEIFESIKDDIEYEEVE